MVVLKQNWIELPHNTTLYANQTQKEKKVGEKIKAYSQASQKTAKSVFFLLMGERCWHVWHSITRTSANTPNFGGWWGREYHKRLMYIEWYKAPSYWVKNPNKSRGVVWKKHLVVIAANVTML